MSLVGEENHPQSIHVLRDTGPSQSLLLEGVLPLSNSSYTGAMSCCRVLSWVS